MTLQFPDGFLFGTATAAYQIEGATTEDDRGPSIWDTFCRTPGKVTHGDTGDIACDHYHRFEADLDLMASLGLNSYRFSISWPRILPTGTGQVNDKGIDFYRRLLEGMHERNITPMATLYHWDLPQALEEAGGWRNRATAEAFADYAEIVATALGDLVPYWVTLNEPWCSAFVGHLEGRHAPGATDLTQALRASHHLLLGHGLAVQRLRGAGVTGEIGITLNLSDVSPGTDSADDQAAAARIDGNENRWFLDPIFRGSYPQDMLDWYGERADVDFIASGDTFTIAQPLDFFGVNYYVKQSVVADPADVVHGARALPPEGPLTGGGIAINPIGLSNLLRRLQTEYTQLPMYITENGATFFDYTDPEGDVDDIERVDFLEGHFRAAHSTIADGVDLRGYFVWSLMDNLEWADGYSRRFGIIYVDFATQTRIPKASARWYQELIAGQTGADEVPNGA
jgi:beta-glucosidase